jgi:hypothetical protein
MQRLAKVAEEAYKRAVVSAWLGEQGKQGEQGK